MGACTRRIAPASPSAKATPALTPVESATLLGACPPREHVGSEPTISRPITSPPMDAIVVEELRKRYGDVQALDGVSFAVQEGEVFGLLGPNGAGKSTTVRSLVTLTTPDSGSASVVTSLMDT